MIKSEEARNPSSCFNRAEGNEPIFVLKSTDAVAPTTVRIWAELYRARKELTNDFGEKQREKWREAMELANQMEEWARNQERTNDQG